MEKLKNIKVKKLIAILLIFVVLQSYFSFFAQTVIAVSDAVIGGGEETPENGGITIGGEEQKEPDEQNNGATIGGENTSTNESSEKENTATEPEENNSATIGGEDSSNETGENTTTEPEETNNEVSNEVAEEETPETPDNTVDNATIGDNKEPEEPYVEPEATVEVSSENPSIYKGYLYANATSDLYYETNYNTIDTITIVGGKNISSLTVQDEQDKIKFITNTKIGLMDDTCYRQTRISVEEFKTIFGKDGNIAVYSPNGEIIGYINENSKVTDGEYVFKYSAMYSSIKFEFTGIEKDGKISIKNDKQIKDNTNYSREQINLFASINTIANVNLYKGEEVKSYLAEGDISLEETESKMTINMDTTDLSIEDENEVAINVTLKTDEERYDLFENPDINIEFPSAVQDLEVERISLLYKNGLSLDSYDVMTNNLGKKVLDVQLTGNQMEYTPGAVHEGTTIVIYAKLDVDRLTADSKDKIKMTYSNKNTVRLSYLLEGKESEDFEMNFVGRQELVRSSKITEADVATITSYDDETEKIQIPVNKEHTVVINNAIVNNYEKELNDVVIVGRIPFVGNEDGNGNDLGTTFDSALREVISTSGVMGDIYYSEDGNALKDDDSWTTDTSDVSKYKSYKIVLKEKTLAKGGRLLFNFSLSIPDTVGYNEKGYTTYTVYYKIDNQEYLNQCTVGMETEEREIELDDIEDDEKEELDILSIGTQVSQSGKVLGQTDSVYERQVLKYTVVVKNTSNKKIDNISIKSNVENANIYDWEIETLENYDGMESFQSKKMKEYTKDEKEYIEFSIESLDVGESKTFEYEAIVRDLTEMENKEVYGNYIISVPEHQDIEISTIKNEVKEAKIETLLLSTANENVSDMTFPSNGRFNIAVDLRNLTENDLKNIDVNVKFSDNVTLNEYFINYFNVTTEKYVEDKEDILYDVEDTPTGQKVVFHVQQLNKGEKFRISFSCNTARLDKNIFSQQFTINSSISVDGEEYNSNEFIRRMYQSEANLEYKWTSNKETNTTLQDGEEVKFYLEVKNAGEIDSGTIVATFERPSGLEIIDAKYADEEATNREEVTIEEKELTTSFLLVSDKETKIEITTKVNSGLYDINQRQIEAKIDVTHKTEPVSLPILSFNIINGSTPVEDEPDEDDSDEDYENPNTQQSPSDSSNGNDNNQPNTNNNQNQQPNTNNDNNQNEPQNNGQNDSNDNNNSNNSQNQTPAQTSDEEDGDEDVNNVGVTYRISGLAWIDKNQDGIRQEDEELKEGVIATLYKANENGGLDTKNRVDSTATGSNGEYIFENVENGKYIIVFDYNSNMYKVTRFQVENAKSTENSDVISKTLTIDGTSRILGVSDVIEINDIGATSIDIGLVDKTNFDMKLEKTISNIIVKNDEGTRAYDYKDVKDGKIEIRSKYFKSTVLDIAYNFKLTNEGDVSGYVNLIQDYLPENVQVVLNRSEGWYVSEDNNLYYNGLAGEEIEPGETKEFTLVLRKDLSNGEAVKLVNSAEIIEVTNNFGLLDRDSIENNKMENEDDLGVATLLIAVATGHSVQYITTTLIIIIMISVIMIVIMKIKNTKKVYR